MLYPPPTQCSLNTHGTNVPSLIALNALPHNDSTLSRSSIKSTPLDQLIEGLLSQ